MGKGREKDKGDKKEQPEQQEKKGKWGAEEWKSRFQESSGPMCPVQVRDQGQQSLKVFFGFYNRGVLFILAVAV